MTRFSRFALAFVFTASCANPALAGVNKDMVQLQTQIQQLQDAVARLQQSNDERMGVLKDLVQQSADSVNRMSLTVDTLGKQLAAQQAASGAKVDQVSGQVQALNDSLDEIKARMNRLEKTLNDVQGLQQNMNASLQNLPQPGGQSGGASVPAALSPSSPAPSTALGSVPALPATGSSRKPSAAVPAAPPAASVDELYKAAYSDFMAAKYPVASSEFTDVTRAYPDNALAGNSFYYLGEIEYRAAKYAAAAKDYDKVLEQYPDNNKIPAAHLHKGEALLQLKQNDAGVRELRALIQRFPNSPEAMSARSKLNALGIPIRPRTTP